MAVANVNPVRKAEIELKRAHIKIMKHKLTYLYAGVLLMGESAIKDDVPTAYTDGVNKYYGTEFVLKQTITKLIGLVLHENFHVVLKHLPRHRDLWKKNAKLANVAADYVVNDWIMQIREKDPAFVELPNGAYYDIKFRNWSVREVFKFLDTGQNNKGKCEGEPKPSSDGNSVQIGGNTYKTEEMDEHDVQAVEDMSAEELKEQGEKVDQAIQQSALLAGAMGVEIPRALNDMLIADERWDDALRDFVNAQMQGHDEYTFAKFNRKRLVDDLFRPASVNERVGRILVAPDLSGSISAAALSKVFGSLALLCEQCKPEELRVLWWDTKVRGEQVFTDNYDNLKQSLKPVGGGGTRVGCVSDYIKAMRLDADCLIVFTDGYVEASPKWEITIPTLWIVDGNVNFIPPAGRKVNFK
jgi:predicted metal-dependent peptidase